VIRQCRFARPGEEYVACNSFYNFITGVTVRLPAASPAGTGVNDDGHHGVRAILTPGEEARTLIGDHIRMLSKLSCAEPNS